MMMIMINVLTAKKTKKTRPYYQTTILNVTREQGNALNKS